MDSVSTVNELVIVGHVAGAVGLNGSIKVKSLSDHPRRFSEMAGQRVLWHRSGSFRRLTVVTVQEHGRYFVLQLDGIGSRAEAEKLLGGDLVVLKDDILPLPEGQFYIFQIVGLEVFDDNGAKLGEVNEVLSLPCHDVYVVAGSSGEICLPALHSVVMEIDLVARRMKVKVPEGLGDTE